jgi:acyl-CoA thioester hydrolase
MPHRVAPTPADFTKLYVETLRYGDTDRQGHVNNAVFATFFETGRVQLFLEPEAGLILEGAEWLLARIEIDYLAELHWPGTVGIGAKVVRVGRSSMTVAQAVFKGDSCVASGLAVVVLIDTATRAPRPLPDAVRALVRD